ncbi:MAG: TRAP transporter fused permease subunit [Candidatus Rokubacteria bacterium]|nr:TRAP transporter fused permease subunit [Candidatus Rokubacteria bacterium]
MGAEPSKFRSLTGAARAAERALLSALTLVGAAWALQAHQLLAHAVFKEQYLGLFLALALGAVFLGVKSHARSPGHRVPLYDWLLCLGGLTVGAYVAVMYPTIAYRLGVLTADKVGLGALAILLVLEATRRLVGWVMVALGAAFILYAKFAYLLPDPFAAKGSSWERIAVYLYLDTNGLFGLPLAVTATIVVAFIFFGQALYAVGGDKFLTNLALVAMGRYRGGPAKVAVVASSLFGTVSGSAVSNVVVDGAITIPMMKRSGYAPHLAAAIEAVASTGGQMMPPVMGVAAFLIAEYLAIPYGEVALAAVIPALLYYLALFVQVDLEAARGHLAGLPRDRLPRFGSVMGQGWSFLVPLVLLVYALMIAVWEAGKAGMVAVIATLVVGALQREDRLTVRKLLTAIEETGRVLLDIVVITALAGFVIGVLQLSGLGFKFSLLLVSLAGGNAFALLALTAIVCIVLGMGMPTAVIYVMLAVLVGPALVQLGIAPLGAHLFLFYFGMLSMITPPVCLATYAAASIARADFMQTGWAGVRLGIVAYLVPFFFAYHPALLLKGTPAEIFLAAITAAGGVILLGIGCAGFLFRPLGWAKRGLAALAGLLLFPPPSGAFWLASNVGGLALGILLVLWERNGARLHPASPDYSRE